MSRRAHPRLRAFSTLFLVAVPLAGALTAAMLAPLGGRARASPRARRRTCSPRCPAAWVRRRRRATPSSWRPTAR